MPDSAASPTKAPTGIEGLDDILGGGFARNRVYIVEGQPGTGKTTVSLQFLRTGIKAGERALYITLSETAEELRAGAASHGWSLDGIEVFELTPPESLFDADQQQSLLYSSDLELGETTRMIFAQVERVKPALIVLDSMSEVRLLAQSSLRYRRQVLALKHYFNRNGATVLMLDDMTAEDHDRHLHSVAHGVLRLEELAPEYGAERRRMRMIKYRGSSFRGGYHDMTIRAGGVVVFPRLVAAEHHNAFDRGSVPTGIAEWDDSLGGGLDPGSTALLIGPSGAGKSLLGITHVASVLKAGGKGAVFLFDEGIDLFVERVKQIGIDLARYRGNGQLLLQAVDPAELSPGEFADLVRKSVQGDGVKTVMIDSINGFYASMPQEQFLVLHMHELLSYLNRRGIVTILTLAQQGLIGDMKSPVDITYLSDTVILLRYFEAHGHVRRAISVVKKRTGTHETAIREYRIDSNGISVGKPLKDFQGVLRGVPVYAGGQSGLFGEDR